MIELISINRRRSSDQQLQARVDLSPLFHHFMSSELILKLIEFWKLKMMVSQMGEIVGYISGNVQINL